MNDLRNSDALKKAEESMDDWWNRLKWRVFVSLMGDLMNRTRWMDVLAVYWYHHRRVYIEENYITATSAITEEFDKLVAREQDEWKRVDQIKALRKQLDVLEAAK